MRFCEESMKFGTHYIEPISSKKRLGDNLYLDGDGRFTSVSMATKSYMAPILKSDAIPTILKVKT